jgi:hypothetical protein
MKTASKRRVSFVTAGCFLFRKSGLEKAAFYHAADAV